MHYFLYLNGTGEWVVEALDEEGGGEVSLTTFSGPGAEKRAREYMAWKQDAFPHSSTSLRNKRNL
jgi:hypothetical protein